MKKILLVLIFAMFSGFLYSQNDCAEPKVESYKKVMNAAFAKEYEKCSVIIEAEYFTDGYLNGWRKPSKLKSMYFFQCVSIGEQGKSAPFSSGNVGDFFVIDKNKADEVMSLKKGDKIKLTGKTFTQNFWGTELSTFFIVEKIEKI